MPIRHPDNEGISALGLKWYAGARRRQQGASIGVGGGSKLHTPRLPCCPACPVVPAVSCLEMSVGGLTYTAAPFTGWYADTEIMRNITEEHR